MKTKNLATLTIFFSCLATNVNADSMKFNLKFLDDSSSELSGFNPTAINDKGQIVSFSSVYDFKTDTFTRVWDIDPAISGFMPVAINDKGDMSGAHFAGGIPAASTYINGNTNVYGTYNENDWSIAEDINNHGTVVVTGIDDKDLIYKDGSSIKFENMPNGQRGSALSINDKNHSAGAGSDDKFQSHAVTWDESGSITILPTYSFNPLGYRSFDSQALDINNHDQIVGFSRGEAVLWQDGIVTALNSPDIVGNISSGAYAINDDGWAVGNLDIISGAHGVLWKDGQMFDLNDHVLGIPQGWVISSAVDINNNGFIIGTIYNQTELKSMGYVISLVPEPTTWAMLLAGLGLVGFMVQRIKHTV